MKLRDFFITKEEMIEWDRFVGILEQNSIPIVRNGFELNVLKGATKSLNTINYVLTEINQAELYENCSLVSELDLFLSNLGFSRVETDFCGGTWGDALYIKDK